MNLKSQKNTQVRDELSMSEKKKEKPEIIHTKKYCLFFCTLELP